jgi:hypothetical protein
MKEAVMTKSFAKSLAAVFLMILLTPTVVISVGLPAGWDEPVYLIETQRESRRNGDVRTGEGFAPVLSRWGYRVSDAYLQ